LCVILQRSYKPAPEALESPEWKQRPDVDGLSSEPVEALRGATSLMKADAKSNQQVEPFKSGTTSALIGAHEVGGTAETDSTGKAKAKAIAEGGDTGVEALAEVLTPIEARASEPLISAAMPAATEAQPEAQLILSKASASVETMPSSESDAPNNINNDATPVLSKEELQLRKEICRDYPAVCQCEPIDPQVTMQSRKCILVCIVIKEEPIF